MSAIRELAQTNAAIIKSGPSVEAVDLSLLDDSLRLTPWQRLLENERALELVRMLEAAQLRANGPAKPNS